MDAIWRLLGTLPPKQRAVLVLRYYLDQDDHQVAETLGCSTSTVRSNVARARSNRRKRVATVGGVLSAVLLVGLGWALEQGRGATDVASEPPGKVIGDE